MKLGIIGRGPWGDTYARTLRRMGLLGWQSNRYWRTRRKMDGLIIACAAEAHLTLAIELITRGVPVLIEKPICLTAHDARGMLELGQNRDNAIVFTGHTRLFSPAWREFKKQALEEGVRSVYAVAGGPCKLDPWLDWGPHLVAMCLDLGFDPHKATFITTDTEVPLHFEVNGGGLYFGDVPTTPPPLEVLITEFVAAIEAGKPDIRGLELGVKVVEYLEAAAGLRAEVATPASGR